MPPRPTPLKPEQVDPDLRARAIVRALMPTLTPGTEVDVVRHLSQLTGRIRRYGSRDKANQSLAANDEADVEKLIQLTGLALDGSSGVSGKSAHSGASA